ncbi:MAG: hypothetical protein ABI594_20475, partial [Ginsengibacter sp.]
MKKKYFFSVQLLGAIIVLSILFSSCDKADLHRRSFEARTKTFYRVSPTAPVPVVVNGTTFIGTAYFPGSGSGKATHLGNCAIYFNQLIYGTSAEAPPAGSVAAPVVDVPGYLVTGAPLPLIQQGDFDPLTAAVASLQIPSQVYGKIINTVFDNGKGDAIFISAITGSGGTFPISQIIVGFNGKALIVGGRGKFAHAVGEIDYDGYFNVADANDAEYNAKGWIS